ncbi:MAG: Subtilisin-like serine protease [Chlorobi bacterium]|nr:Subtilisin-like serine protease [Chlorobiota bacterium]
MIMRQRILLFILIAIGGAGICRAQTLQFRYTPRDADGISVQGEIRIKVTRDAFARGVTAGNFGAAAARYGIYDITPWINPKLLAWHAPAYKTTFGSGTEEPGLLPLMRILIIHYSSLDPAEQVAGAFQGMPGVEYAEPVYKRTLMFAPNDPLVWQQQQYLDKIGAPLAWDNVRADNSFIIAVTDAGIERTHPDLKDAIWTNPGETGRDSAGNDKATNGKDDDGNGYTDDWWGYDFAGSNGTNPDNDPSPGASHGTHVAGIAAASGNNSVGGTGVAFGVRIMSVKIGDDAPEPDLFNEAEGVLYAAVNGAKVINCSWGGSGSSIAEAAVFEKVQSQFGAVVVAACGNKGRDQAIFPASYPGVISVASVTTFDAKATSSNYNVRVDVSAPGENIFSTLPGSSYGLMSGTSMAAPMVSGAAALIRKKYPDLNPAQVAEVIRATADDISGAFDPIFRDKMGTGRLNVGRAVTGGASIRSARMMTFRIAESNPDGVVDPGEAITIRADIKNILANSPTVTATLVAVNASDITVQGPTQNFGAMTTGQTLTTEDSVFRVMIPAGAQPNSVLTFKITVTTPDRSSIQYFSILVAPTYLTTNYNQIAATFNSIGNIAYNGFNTKQGDGFSFGRAGELLFHGGLMIGTGADHLSEVVRVGGLTEGESDGFHSTQSYRLRMSTDSSVQIGTAKFNDAHLGAAGAGVDVEMHTYEYRDPSASNIVVVGYTIRNTNPTPLHGLRCGLYLDWDVSPAYYYDQTGYDSLNRLAYQRDTRDEQKLFTGAALLTHQDPGFYGVDNEITAGGDSIEFGFTTEKKWKMLSARLHENSLVCDAGMVISAGSIDLAPNDTTTVEFALLVAPDFPGLRSAAQRALELRKLSAVPASPAIAGSRLNLQAYPSPFPEITDLRFTMPRHAHAGVVVYDLRGNVVASIYDGDLDAGEYRFPFNSAGLPDGTYLYEVRAGTTVEHGKVVKLGR